MQSINNLSLQQLKQVVAIREKIDDLEKQLSRIIGGVSAALPGRRKMSAAARAKISKAAKARWAKRGGKKRISKKPSSRGQLKGRIIRALKSAGKSGAGVSDLAKKLGSNYSNISVWFHTTAKGVKEIKKVAPGRFAWTS